MSGASERVNGHASGPVFPSRFLAVLLHCAIDKEMNMLMDSHLGVAGSKVIGVETSVRQSLVGTALGIALHIGEDLGRDDGITGHEVGVGHLVGQTQHANTDSCWVNEECNS